MSAQPDKLRAIFSEALAKATPEERERYLAAACVQDPELRRQADSLLEAHAQAGEFLGQSVIAPKELPIGERPRSVIGRYKLLQQIGEGGFGVVFMAEQQEPVRRMVALKIIKPGMDTREVVARFEAGRQALALMDHPNIARVLDGGTTDSGRPFFVMELIKGIPITEFCDQHQLTIEARLQLFMKVCAGVQHAHQKGVIHRDLKPSNVIVTLHDGEPVPKVIDFGVAKAIGQKLTERTLFTRFEQLIGTPAYMSPEQAEWSGLDIDTRSDLYSLGVLLYELLTGTTPLEKETLASAALDEMRRMIRETDPPMPSTRLETGLRGQRSEVGGRTSDVAGQGLEVKSASLRQRLQAVRGDLDWIVMKALEKDRTRRYETVNGLARDIERHLEGEPVAACPPSQAYRAGKFIRKHRVAVSAGAVVVLALITGLVFALVGFAQARSASQRAQGQAAIAKAVNDFLLNDLLGQASPLESPDRDVKLLQVLDRAAEKITGRFTNQLLVEASIRQTIGRTYLRLGQPATAEEHLKRAAELRTQQLGPEHPETLESQWQLAVAYGDQGTAKGEPLLREVIKAYQHTLGPEDTNTLGCLWELAGLCLQLGRSAEAGDILRDLLEKERRICGAAHSMTLETMELLAQVYAASGRTANAADLREEILRTGDPLQGPVSNNLAFDYLRLGDYPRALELLSGQVEAIRRRFGPEASVTAVGNLAAAYAMMGLWPRSLDLCRILLESTTNSEKSMVSGLHGAAAALLAGKTNEYREMAGKMLARFATTTNTDWAITTTLTCLLLPDAMPNLEPVFKLADSVPPGGPELQNLNKSAKGMAAYRRGNLAESFHWFEGWDRQFSNGADDARAGYFCAMIHFRQGDAIAAHADMEAAGKRLAVYLQSGQLGLNWSFYAHAVAARAEAERLILGREVSKCIDSRGLEEARRQWEPVRQHFTQGDRLAGQQRWSEARNEYIAATKEPGFTWEAAESAHAEGGSRLATRVGITFLLAKDSASHEQLYRPLLARWEEYPDPITGWHLLRACLAGELNPTNELTGQADRWVQMIADKPAGVAAEAVGLLHTMAAYRSGRYQEAAVAAKSAQGGRLSVRNAAQIVRAMALAKLGRWEDGKTDLQQAESNLAKPLKNLTGDLWWDLAMCQLLLDEAHRLFGERK
jgi:eukaryotic-like serine/threonine-protein kinase